MKKPKMLAKAKATGWYLWLNKTKTSKIFDSDDLFITSKDISGENVKIIGQVIINKTTYRIYQYC